jgi:hypothetical protein
MKHFLLLLLTCLAYLPSQGQLPIFPTVFSSTSQDRIVSATVGAQGRVYLLGYSYSPPNGGGVPTPPAIRTPTGSVPFTASGSSYFVAVYGPSGLEQQQVVRGTDLRSIAVDNAGNIYLTGRDQQYIFLLEKLNAALQLQWALTYGTSAGAWGNKVLVDAQGNSYVAGTAQNWSIFGQVLQTRSCCPANDFIIKVNPQGVLQWVHAGGDGGINQQPRSAGNSLAFDRAGNVVMVGELSGVANYGNTQLVGPGNGRMFAVKYTPAGNVLWAKTYGTSQLANYGSSSANDVAIDEFDNLYLCGSFSAIQQFGTVSLPSLNYNSDALLLKLDPLGEPLWASAGNLSGASPLGVSAFTSISYRAGKIKVGGYSEMTPLQYDSKPLVASYQANGHFAWSTNFNASNVAAVTKVLIDANQTSHVFGYFKNTLRVGTASFASYAQEDGFYVQLLDSARYKLSCTIRGTVYYDANQNCQAEAGEARLGGIIVEAQPGPYFAITDSLGRYAIATDTGRYTVRQALPQLPGRTITPTCPAGNVSGLLALPTPGSLAAGVDFGDALPTGPYLVTSVSSGRRRRCAPGTTAINYSNLGVAASPAAQVFVKLPRYVVFKSANYPFTLQPDSTYAFAVGALAPGQTGTILIRDSVVCGNTAIRGLTICTRAWITPGKVLTRPAGWNEASIVVQGRLLPGNVVRFVLRNEGVGATTDSLAMRIYQDTQLALTHRFSLPAGDSLVLRVPATAAVARLEADQPLAHPLSTQTSATVEVPGLRPPGGLPSPAMSAFPPSPSAPSASEECLPIADSFDPNDKQVVPTGLTAQRYTPTNTPLRFEVRFQNTGTAPAYRVVVVDTLAANLDVSTLRVGAGSHRFRMQVSGKSRPVLTFTFDPIDLPARASNAAGSQGFVQFTIQPVAGLPDYTAIRNHADIYFDYNAPVRTDTTVNRLHDVPLAVNPAVALSYPAVLASPTIITLAPAQGRVATLVTITGQRFAATSQVFFNGTPAPVLSATATRLTTRVPTGATTGPVKVVTPDGAVQSGTDFVVYQAPTLAAIAPAEAQPGEIVTLTGTHFSAVATQDTVWFNGVPAPVRAASATALQVAVPVGATTGRVRISTLGGSVESAQPFLVWYPPAIARVSPAKARAGALVTLTGTNFADVAARNIVSFGAGRATVLQASTGSVQVRVPATAESGAVRLETPGGAASAAGFVFLPAPVVLAMSPGTGSVGTQVLLTGSNFQVDAQADTVFFAGVPARVVGITASALQVLVPKGAHTGPVTIAGAGGRGSSKANFEVLALTPEEAIAVYPTPTNGALTVNWERAEFAVQRLTLYDALGQRLLSQSFDAAGPAEIQLHLESYRPGMYVLMLQTTAGRVLKRISRW